MKDKYRLLLSNPLTPHKPEARNYSSKGTPVKLTYRQLEDLLARLHSVHPTNRVALQGRIKHFQRNGWPGGTNTGKGRAASYDFGSVLKLCLGFELLEIGITPERAASLLLRNWDSVRTALSLSFSAHPKNEGEREPFEVFLYCDPNALASLTNDPKQMSSEDFDPTDETFFYSSSPQLARSLLDYSSGMPRRLALVNLSGLLSDIGDGLEVLHDDLRSYHQEWDYQERLSEVEADPEHKMLPEFRLKG